MGQVTVFMERLNSSSHFPLHIAFRVPVSRGLDDSDPGWPDPDVVAANVEKFKPTIMLSVPTFYRNLLRDGSARRSLQGVRYYLTAGEKMPEPLFNEWMEATGRPALEGIGATETCFLFLANRPDQLAPDLRRTHPGDGSKDHQSGR